LVLWFEDASKLNQENAAQFDAQKHFFNMKKMFYGQQMNALQVISFYFDATYIMFDGYMRHSAVHGRFTLLFFCFYAYSASTTRKDSPHTKYIAEVKNVN